MQLHHSIWGLVLLWTYVRGLIVPEEVPTVLNFINTLIPRFKIGTDSRVGVGFRFGRHADFQVLFELGPQTETAPIGPNADSGTKRSRQASKPTAYVQAEPNQVGDAVAETPGGKWLSSWRSSLINTRPAKPEKPHLLGYQNAHSSVQNEYIGSHLSQLYKNAKTNTTTETTTLSTFTKTSEQSSTSIPHQENIVVNRTSPNNEKEKTEN